MGFLKRQMEEKRKGTGGREGAISGNGQGVEVKAGVRDEWRD